MTKESEIPTNSNINQHINNLQHQLNQTIDSGSKLLKNYVVEPSVELGKKLVDNVTVTNKATSDSLIKSLQNFLSAVFNKISSTVDQVSKAITSKDPLGKNLVEDIIKSIKECPLFYFAITMLLIFFRLYHCIPANKIEKKQSFVLYIITLSLLLLFAVSKTIKEIAVFDLSFTVLPPIINPLFLSCGLGALLFIELILKFLIKK